MAKANDLAFHVISMGDLVMLRSHLETDRDYYKRWQTQGEWLLFDAPWAESVNEDKHDQDKKSEQKYRMIQDPKNEQSLQR